MKSIYLEKSIEIIFNSLKGIISENEYSFISARKNEGEKVTQTTFQTYESEKLSRIVMEQYTVNSKANGVVLNIYPKPDYAIPIFTFQLGGQIPEKVIFVLDIVPTTETGEDPKMNALSQHHASIMKNLGSEKDWIHEICSKNALICQYKPLEPDMILHALADYLNYWKKCHDELPGPEKNEARLKDITEHILTFKRILHANDAGLEIYKRKFGKEMSAAIERAAFGSSPSLLADGPQNGGNASEPVDNDLNLNLQIKWTTDAEQYLLDAPRFVRSKIKDNAEKKAEELGINEITRSFIENLRK